MLRAFETFKSNGMRIAWNRVPRPAVSAGKFQEEQMPTLSPTILPILMLFASNVFMTFAWYGHLKFKERDRLCRILAGGACQPLGQRGLFGGAAQDHAGGDHAGGVRRLLGALPEGAAGMESRARFSLHRDRRVSDFPQMGVSWLPFAMTAADASIISRPALPARRVRSNCRSAATARRPAPGGRP